MPRIEEGLSPPQPPTQQHATLFDARDSSKRKVFYIYNVATHVQHAPACLLSARPPRGRSLLLRRRRSDALRCMQGLLFIPRHINERAASLLWVRYEHAASIDKTQYEQRVRRWTPSTKRPCAQAKDF
jgi:hypothetical protein